MSEKLILIGLLLGVLHGCAVHKGSITESDMTFPRVNARAEVKGKITESQGVKPGTTPPVTPSRMNELQPKLDHLLSLRVGAKSAFRSDSNRDLQDDKVADPPAAPVKLISVNMHDGRLEQLFWELARKLELNLIIEPGILKTDAKVSINLKDVSASEVLLRIIEIFDLYPSIVGNTLMVREYEEKIFNLDVLNTRSNLSVNSGGDALGGSSSNKGSVSMSMEGGDKTDQFDQVVKGIESLLTEQTDASKKDNRETRIAVNKPSGTVLVRAKPPKVRLISDFVSNMKKMLTKQVQIDVQLVDVQLNDEYSLGIDWGILTNNIAVMTGAASAVIPGQTASFPAGRLGTYGPGMGGRIITLPQQIIGNPGTTAGGGGMMINTGRGGVILNALSQFGSVKLVSNPSLRIKNGVPAYISVGTNYRIVSKVTTTSTPTGGGTAQSSTDVQTDSIFSGIVLAVTALVREDDGIEIFVHPSQSRAREDRLALIPVSANASVTLPVIEQKSLSTTLKLKSNDLVILGGLIDQQAQAANSGLPGLSAPTISESSFLGSLFGKKQNSKSARELIVVLSARLL